MRRFVLLTVFLAAACDVAVDSGPSPAAVPQPGQGFSPAEASAAFAAVTRLVEPVAERECRARTQGLNCDFKIQVDPDRRAAPNAYQSLDRNGRPVITFTQSMLGELSNRDELAFVMSHEAAHHIRGHLARQQENALSGAVIFAGLATIAGATAGDIANAQDLGAFVGARSYSKDFELEADQLGAIITHKAGYRPSEGVKFFARLPDPGDRFLGTHPANYDRVQVVNDTIRQYGLN
jgi:Zn-dependent protease with chaperone function